MKEWNIILVTDSNWQIHFCTVTLKEQQIMERNEKKKQDFSKNNQYF